jgi:hypothetical protein
LKERLGAIIKSKKHTRAAIIVSVALILALGCIAVALGAGRVGNVDKVDYPVATISYNGQSTVVPLGNKEQIPYVEPGSTISINFGDVRPSSISVTEVIARADGSRKYAEMTDKILDVELSGRSLATFKVEQNIGDFLSSDSNDYLAGNAWRWYRIICNDDGRSVSEYSLWIRTDPAGIMTRFVEPSSNYGMGTGLYEPAYEPLVEPAYPGFTLKKAGEIVTTMPCTT